MKQFDVRGAKMFNEENTKNLVNNNWINMNNIQITHFFTIKWNFKDYRVREKGRG